MHCYFGTLPLVKVTAGPVRKQLPSKDQLWLPEGASLSVSYVSLDFHEWFDVLSKAPVSTWDP
jgi:hypothetical protein